MRTSWRKFQRALFADVRQTFQTLQNQDDRAPLRAEDLPAALRHRFCRHQREIFFCKSIPNTDVWQRANQEKFIAGFAVH